MERTFEELCVTAIAPSPFNPRKDFDGEDFKELVASIAKVGVLEPVLVRPVDGDRPFELVAGERRWRARMAVAENNGGIDAATIPALVQPMDDDLALDIQTIENLQRKDLTGLEEAEAFRIFVDRKGHEAIPELAERTGIKESYIRRRLMILRLPKKILSAWGKGELKYGHLEQLARMDDRKQRAEVLKWIRERQQWGTVTIADLKGQIARMSPALKKARFNIEAGGCLTCSQNSDVQMKLFDMDGGDPRCNRPACFRQKQREHIEKNWSRTKYSKKYGTAGFRFNHEFSYNDCEVFWSTDKVNTKCRSCEHHLTILDLDGDSCYDRACFGDKKCFGAMKAARSAGGSSRSKPKKKEGPRVAWHGQHFREQFFQQQLPQRFESVPSDSLTVHQVTLFSLIRGNDRIHGWFAERHGVGRRLWDDGPLSLDAAAAFKLIAGMNEQQVLNEIKSVALQAVLSDGYMTWERWLVARHIGIDLSREWRFNEEYLQKKTKGEMMEFGENFGLFDSPGARAFLNDTLKRKSFNACKKGELIRVFLESGADTSGMVPGEILADDPMTEPDPGSD